jgi:3-deoxy-D-manno-octulosonic-acid transferase
VKPRQACFVKYEYWPNYFQGCKKRGIPLILISAILRPGQRFFGFWSFFWKPVMQSVTHYFVQDDATARLLGGLGIERCTVTGDTRFDRVLDVAANAPELKDAASWANVAKVLIGGSTWPADERVLFTWWQQAPKHWKLLLVPHEVGPSHIQALLSMWPEARLWSKRSELSFVEARVLIVDEVGALSTLYRYANLAWIGGGFGAGIHNTLEPAAWKIPIAFGPKHAKFSEALGLIACGAASTSEDEVKSAELLARLTADEDHLARMGTAAGHFVLSGRGATDKIMSFLRGDQNYFRKNS